jgi:hypothetical protein
MHYLRTMTKRKNELEKGLKLLNHLIINNEVAKVKGCELAIKVAQYRRASENLIQPYSINFNSKNAKQLKNLVPKDILEMAVKLNDKYKVLEKQLAQTQIKVHHDFKKKEQRLFELCLKHGASETKLMNQINKWKQK